MSTRFASADEVQAAFYRAFEELDLDLMGQVWIDDPEAVCIHPGGDLLEGREAILQSWAEIFAGAHQPTLVHRTLRRETAGDLEVHLVEELIRPSGGTAPPSRVVASNLYRRRRDGWRMLAHHASLPLMRAHARQRGGRLH
jgi:ketosteroid isomerase-like protein